MIPTVTDPLGTSPVGRRLQYLASTGTQYIDTGVIPDFANGDSIEISFYGASFTGAQPCVTGSRETNVRNGIYILPQGITFADGDGYTSLALLFTGNLTVKIGSTLILDDNEYAVPRAVTCGLPIYLFALNNYGTGTYGIYSGMRLYDWKYWHGGTLAQYLVPVLDRQGVPCLYDTVSRTLKYNAGTGTFDYA